MFDAPQFDTQALMHNLREQDYGKTMAELRPALQRPRLPLPYDGDRDLQQAIY